SGERNVALAMVKGGNVRDVALTPLYLFAAHLLSDSTQRGLRETRLPSVEMLLGPHQRPADNIVRAALNLPSRDLLLIELDSVPHGLLHAVEVERRIGRHPLRHLADEALRDLALLRRLLGIVRDQQIEDR